MELNSRASLSFINKPQAIIFDWDNTLVETWPAIRDALNTTLIAFGLSPWTMQETRKRVKKSMRDSFPGLFGDDWERAAELFYKRYYEIHIQKLKVVKGAQDLIVKLVSRGIYLAIVSNKRGDVLRTEVIHLGWSDHFGAMIGANDAVKDKPARDPVDLALSSPKIKAGPKVWFVGDADIDIECAKNAECFAIIVGPEREKYKNSTAKADLEFPNCMALSKFIDKLYS